MIARGDLAVEVGFERLAEVQEEILWLCEAAHVPVIWATQVLESVAQTGQPSRAEVTDAAMAERAECVMLNKGPHIGEAVRALDASWAGCRATEQEAQPAAPDPFVGQSSDTAHLSCPNDNGSVAFDACVSVRQRHRMRRRHRRPVAAPPLSAFSGFRFPPEAEFDSTTTPSSTRQPTVSSASDHRSRVAEVPLAKGSSRTGPAAHGPWSDGGRRR